MPACTCPRCGYDQSGIVATWEAKGACPLDGTCSECGLVFRWCEVLNERLRITDRFYEHAARRHVYPAAWRTWWWAVRPARLWSKVGMHHEVRVARLLAWLPVLLAPLWLAHGVPNVVSAGLWALEGRWIVTAWETATTAAWAVCEPFPVLYPLFGMSGSRSLVCVPWGIRWAGILPPLLAASAMTLLILACTPVTRRRSKVRVVHLARLYVYSHAWLVVFGLVALAQPLVTLGEAATVALGGFAAYDDLPIAPVPTGSGLWGTWLAPGRPPTGIAELMDRAAGVRGTASVVRWAWLAACAVWLIAWWWRGLRVGLKLPLTRLDGVLVLAASAAAALLIAVSTTDLFPQSWF